MSGQFQHFIPVAQILGLSSCSALTAYITSFSITTVPALQAAPVSATEIAKQWDRAYNLGKMTAPPLAITCSSCFMFLAYQLRDVKGSLLISPSALYTTAAVIAPCIVPFTATVMDSTLKGITAKAASKATAPSDAETKALIQKWSGQNLIRASFVGTAAVLSAIAMLA